MTKVDIINMPITEYKERFGKDPMEIIDSLENKTQESIEEALYQFAMKSTEKNESN